MTTKQIFDLIDEFIVARQREAVLATEYKAGRSYWGKAYDELGNLFVKASREADDKHTELIDAIKNLK